MMRVLITALMALILASPPAGAMKDSFPGEVKLIQRLAPEERLAYFGLQYTMNRHQRKAFLSIASADGRAEWLHRYWSDVDPTPATAENEKRTEHEKRVALARKLYASTKAPGWDRRGEAVIRWGLPTDRTKVWGSIGFYNMTPPGEIWYYESLDMIVQFQNANLKGEFIFSSDPVGRSSRRELDRSQNITNYLKYGVMQEVLPTQYMSPDEIKDLVDFNPDDIDYMADPETRMITLRDRISEIEKEKIDEKINNFYAAMEDRPSLYSFEINQSLLPLYFDVTAFRGGDRMVRVEINFEVPASELTFVKQGGESKADVEFRALVRDLNMREVASASDVIQPTATGDEFKGPSLLPGQIVLALEPGYYRLGLEARDRCSRRRAAYRTNLELAVFDGSPDVSNIQFASSIRETEQNQRFAKGALQVVPHPAHAYRIPFPLSVYFEIYGLDTDREGLAFYRIEYTIVPREKRRRGPVLEEVSSVVSSSFETNGYGATQPQHLSIATENLWEGSFRLIVTVTDRRTMRTMTQMEDFSILK